MKCYAKTLRSAVKILCSITLDCTPPIFGSISSGNTREFFIFVKELCWILKKNMISFSLYIWKTVNRYIYNVLMLRSMKVCVEGKSSLTDKWKVCEQTMNQSEKILEIKDLCVEFQTVEGTVKAINHLNYTLLKLPTPIRCD